VSATILLILQAAIGLVCIIAAFALAPAVWSWTIVATVIASIALMARTRALAGAHAVTEAAAAPSPQAE